MSDNDATYTRQDDATKQLRAMLDERGVSWDYGPSGASSTAFWVNGKELSFSNCRDGLVCSTIFTPAQAIAATIERGTCYDIGEYPAFRCSECGGWTFVQTGNCYALIDSGSNVFESPTYCPLCGRKVVSE